jgi:hypothetical protein
MKIEQNAFTYSKKRQRDGFGYYPAEKSWWKKDSLYVICLMIVAETVRPLFTPTAWSNLGKSKPPGGGLVSGGKWGS